MLDAIIVVLMGTVALVLGVVLLMSVGVRTVVLVRHIFLLSTGHLGLELFIYQRNLLFKLIIFSGKGGISECNDFYRTGSC